MRNAIALLAMFFVVMCGEADASLFRAKISFLVIDELSGEPLDNARIGVNFSTGGWSPKTIHTDWYTNAKGKVTASGRGIGYVGYTVFYDGYYTTSEGLDFDDMDVVKHRFLPWNQEVIVKMRKIGKQVPMYAKRVYGLIPPVSGKPIGYDLMIGDWVAPYGGGEISDFIFLLDLKYVDKLNYEINLRLTFSNECDGINFYPKENLFPTALKLPSTAPEIGYVSHLEKYRRREPNKYTEDNSDKNQHYYFRVRSVVEDGKIKKAMYGKIYDDISVSLASPINGKHSASFSFSYYLNPDYSRNVEFDMDRNLLPENSFHRRSSKKPKAN